MSIGNYLLMLAKRSEDEKERVKNDALKTTTLRKALQLYDPENKDQYGAMGLQDLEGTIMSHTLKQSLAQYERLNELKQDRKVAGDVVQEYLNLPRSRMVDQAFAGGPTRTGAQLLDRVRGGDVPLPTQADLFEAIRRVPGAGRNPDLLNSLLNYGETAARKTAAGEPEDKMIGGTRYVFNRMTGQFVADPFSRAEAQAENRKDADGSIEIPDPQDPVYGARIRIPLSVARKEYPHLLKGLEKKTDANYDQELKLAMDALAQGAKRDKVAARFKERTGKDLPQ